MLRTVSYDRSRSVFHSSVMAIVDFVLQTTNEYNLIKLIVPHCLFQV